MADRRNWVRFARLLRLIPGPPGELASFRTIGCSRGPGVPEIGFVWRISSSGAPSRPAKLGSFCSIRRPATGLYPIRNPQCCHPGLRSGAAIEELGSFCTFCPLGTGSGSPKLGLFRTVRPSVASHYCDKKHKKNRGLQSQKALQPKEMPSPRRACPRPDRGQGNAKSEKRDKQRWLASFVFSCGVSCQEDNMLRLW